MISLTCTAEIFQIGAGLSGYVAELSSAFCCAALGIKPTVRHADYIGAWIDTMREDSRAIFRAASQASKAADWLLSFLPATTDAYDSGDAGTELATTEIDRRAA